MRNYLFVILTIFFIQNGISQEIKLEGKDAILVRQKTTCGTLDVGKTYYGMWEGRAWSRVPGEKDKHLLMLLESILDNAKL